MKEDFVLSTSWEYRKVLNVDQMLDQWFIFAFASTSIHEGYILFWRAKFILIKMLWSILWIPHIHQVWMTAT